MHRITDKELRNLESCQEANDWTIVVNNILRSRGGDYPDDWWEKVKMSGLMDKVFKRWGDSSELKISSHQTFREVKDHLKRKS